MGCSYNKEELRIVRGNSFHLRVQVTARRLDGTVVEDFDLGQADAVLKVLYSGKATTKAFTVDGNDAIIDFDGTEKMGWYGLEMSGVYESEAWRWCVEKVFQIVNTNAKGNVPEWAVYLDDTYVVAGSFSMVGVANAVQSDWTETDPTSPAFILNKPDLNYYGTEVTQNMSTGATSITSKGRTVGIITGQVPTGSSAMIMGVTWEAMGRQIGTRQAKLVSGTNIKTVNGESLLGSGDMVIHDAYVRDIDASGLMDVGGKSIEDASIYNDIHAAYTAGKYVCVRLVDADNGISTILPIYDTVNDYKFVSSVTLNETGTIVAIVSVSGALLVYLTFSFYEKPSGGIPSSDLASGVQTSLGKADAAIPMPSGGSAGQVLKKTSDGVAWANESGGGSSDYTDLTNKPQINSNTLSGNKSASDLGLATAAQGAKADSAYQKPSGGIPSSDMASGVQTSLGKADSAYQKPSGGIPSSDMATAVQTSLGKADSAYQKPSGGIPSSDMATAVQTSLGKADSAIQGVKVNGTALTPDANKAVDVKTHDAIVSHGTSDTTFALTPNVFHTWGEVASLTLTLATPSDNTVVNEYMFEFQSGSTATTLSLPATVEWDADKGDIDIESGYIYQVSILNNLALWGRKEVTS